MKISMETKKLKTDYKKVFIGSKEIKDSHFSKMLFFCANLT